MVSILDQIQRKAREAAFEADKQRRILAVQSQISQIKSNVLRQTRRLGERVLELHDTGALAQPELAEMCLEIETLRAQVAEKETEIERIRAERLPEEVAPPPSAVLYGHICPQCQIKLPDQAVFCPYCGSRAVDVPQPAPAAHTCHKCGALLVAGAVFCPFCGTRVETGTPQAMTVLEDIEASEGKIPLPTAEERENTCKRSVLTSF